MTDLYAGAGDTLDSPASRLRAIAPSDTASLQYATKALYVGGAGDVAVLAVNDTQAVTLKAVPAGTVLRIRVGQVLATGTTATGLVALI